MKNLLVAGIVSVMVFAGLCLTYKSAAAQTRIAPDEILKADNVQLKQDAIYFEDTEKPDEPGRILIDSCTTLSSDTGERWAMITIRNNERLSIEIDNEDIFATFADGKQVSCRNMKTAVPAKSFRSVTVFFGYSRFPIVSVDLK